MMTMTYGSSGVGGSSVFTLFIAGGEIGMMSMIMK